MVVSYERKADLQALMWHDEMGILYGSVTVNS